MNEMDERPLQCLVVVAEALESARPMPFPVYGILREREGVTQILSSDAASSTGLREIGVVEVDGGHPPTVAVPVGSDKVHIRLASDIPMPDRIEVEHLSDAESRRVGLVSSGGLVDKRVTLFGAGSVGSALALLLAQSGVGFLRIVDRDWLEASNLSRHSCDLLDLGRAKALAVADLCRRRGATVEASGHDILEANSDELVALVREADLVLATTDSAAAQFVVNEACVIAGIPAIYATCYERACGGEVIVVRPGHGPCLYCAVGFRVELAPDLAPAERRQAYQASDADNLDAEPGLAVDITHLVSVAAAYSLAVLDPDGSRKALLDPARSFVLVHGGSTPRGSYADLFADAFDLAFARVRRQEPCPVCGYVTNEAASA